MLKKLNRKSFCDTKTKGIACVLLAIIGCITILTIFQKD